jgi:L-ascorbate metabolism protein UlaG (beta-lactamase superfamily)
MQLPIKQKISRVQALLNRWALSQGSTPPVFPSLKEDSVSVTWIGHASFLIQTKQLNILVDPNWSNWIFTMRRKKRVGLSLNDLPHIDLVLITHAHFDHLNKLTLRSIASQQTIIVPKGVGNLVHRLGFQDVIEMQWWDRIHLPHVKITFTPARHWGARIIMDHHRGYGGYVMEFENSKTVYHCGDSAYFEGFQEIGARLAPQIALMPIGCYQPLTFQDHHINPEQALKAFVELKAQEFVPMHWGTYRLSYEASHEPPKRLMMAAAQNGLLNRIHFLNEGMPRVF